MKKHFENTKLNYVIFCFLLVKLFCAIFYLYPIANDFFCVFAYHLPWTLLILSMFLPNGLVVFALALLTFCLFLISMVLLLLNTRSAGFALILLMVLCILDAVTPIVWGLFPFAGVVSFVFNIAIVLMLVVLRRSGPDATADLPNINPTKI